jgi:hypothetical protein
MDGRGGCDAILPGEDCPSGQMGVLILGSDATVVRDT